VCRLTCYFDSRAAAGLRILDYATSGRFHVGEPPRESTIMSAPPYQLRCAR
jgi:hypothetical protein